MQSEQTFSTGFQHHFSNACYIATHATNAILLT